MVRRRHLLQSKPLTQSAVAGATTFCDIIEGCSVGSSKYMWDHTWSKDMRCQHTRNDAHEHVITSVLPLLAKKYENRNINDSYTPSSLISRMKTWVSYFLVGKMWFSIARARRGMMSFARENDNVHTQSLSLHPPIYTHTHRSSPHCTLPSSPYRLPMSSITDTNYYTLFLFNFFFGSGRHLRTTKAQTSCRCRDPIGTDTHIKT